jgi:hypothetical protein
MKRATQSYFALVIAGLLLAPACSDNPAGPDWPIDPDTPYDLNIPTQWVTAVTHPLLPLVAGTRWTFEGETEDGTETIVVEVVNEKRMVNGVAATVVWDRVYLDGELIEDTRDWYAQDPAGNVWYLGEESYEMAGTDTLNMEGSWEWGVDGALPGVLMWADPAARLNQPYRQEYYEDEAEDWGMVVATNLTLTVPAGTFTGCLQTEDWNALEDYRGSLEQKFYCPAVGWVKELPVQDPEEAAVLIEFVEP